MNMKSWLYNAEGEGRQLPVVSSHDQQIASPKLVKCTVAVKLLLYQSSTLYQILYIF